jgi:hypothetical protein
MRKKQLLRVLEAAQSITQRRCDIFVPPYTCITEDDGTKPWEPCDPCLLAQAGVPIPCTCPEWEAWQAVPPSANPSCPHHGLSRTYVSSGNESPTLGPIGPDSSA